MLDELTVADTPDAWRGMRLVGWSPRPIEETIVDCAQSLIDEKVV